MNPFSAVAADSSLNWQVYMILCSDGSLYTGITTHVERRFAQHLQGRGAKYFRARRPCRVVYVERGHSHSSAARREIALKRLSRPEKDALVAARQNLPVLSGTTSVRQMNLSSNSDPDQP